MSQASPGPVLLVLIPALLGGGATAVLAQDDVPLQVRGPRLIATGLAVPVSGTGALPGQPVELQRRGPRRWHVVRTAQADGEGKFMFRYSPSREARRYLLRARVGAATSPSSASRTSGRPPSRDPTSRAPRPRPMRPSGSPSAARRAAQMWWCRSSIGEWSARRSICSLRSCGWCTKRASPRRSASRGGR
jgi:hypothetical protein